MAVEKQTTAQEQKSAATKKAVEKVKEQVRKKSLFEKIQAVRVGLQDEEIKKSGKMNGRSEKPYLELADFIHPLNKLMLAERFTAIVNFSPEEATLTAYDFDSDQTFAIKSPMREAKVQGCNEMQNLGAVETYQRRYLYMAMFDIAESDILDGGTGNNGKGGTDKSFEKPTPEHLKEAQELQIDLNNVAAYWKKSVEEISDDDLATSIEMQKAAIAKMQAKAQKEKQQKEQQKTEQAEETK